MNERRGHPVKSTLMLYVSSAFVLTAAMTVLITAAAIIVVWNVNRGFILTDRDIYLALVAGGFVALLLSGTLGVFFASGIVQPITRISKTAVKLKEGDLSARTGMHGDDEITQLGETFDAMADSVERERDLERQLIGDVAHELRTPLMAVQATAEAIQDGVFPADEEHLSTISSETRRLGRLVEALLHLNRLENGTIVAKSELVDVSELLESLFATHEALVESSGLTFTSEIEHGVLVDGDHDLLLQAVANLVSNAVRYTPEGGSVHVSLARDAGYARISVADTGVGIAEEDLGNVFSRFWRADSARSSIGGGLGVGLALVKEVADQHRGSVAVQSVLGEGSTFHLCIPLSGQDGGCEEADSREARRVARAARKETEKQRKEQEKVRKLQERQVKQQLKAAEKARRQDERSGSSLSFLGIDMTSYFKKDDDGGPDS